MAVQDFAQVEVPQIDVEKPLTRVKTMFLTVLSVLLVLGTFMAGFWLGQKQGIETASGEDKAHLEKLLREQQKEMNLLRQEAATKQAEPKVSTTQVGDLTFYNELPHQSVKPAPLHATRTPKKGVSTRTSVHVPSSTLEMRKMIEKEMHQSAKKVTKIITPKSVNVNDSKAKQRGFVLQVGSFQKQADADAFVPKLTKRGFSPLIRRVELPNLGVWYRVYIAGYDSKKAALKAKKAVKKSLNITALVLKAR
ncbi:MAG: SPOR domain-containing protein [Mariprofundaceae bacterium]|nr:SPOR domain-containing protein [Mariprofundaceae bacterium]